MRTKQWTLMKTYEWGMLRPRRNTELFDRQADPGEENDLSQEHPEVVAELELEYFRWVEEQLRGRPDPLRIAAAENRATKAVKRRYERWLAEQKARAAQFTAEDRAKVDHKQDAE